MATRRPRSQDKFTRNDESRIVSILGSPGELVVRGPDDHEARALSVVAASLTREALLKLWAAEFEVRDFREILPDRAQRPQSPRISLRLGW